MKTESERGGNKWIRDLFEKLIVAQLLKIFSAYDDPRKSTTILCSEPDKSNTLSHSFFKIHFIIIIPSESRTSKWKRGRRRWRVK
jgi:hypothetical protein